MDSARIMHQAAEVRQVFLEEQREFLRNRQGVVFWDGSPKPKILQKPRIRDLMDQEIHRFDPMRRPGEVRS